MESREIIEKCAKFGDVLDNAVNELPFWHQSSLHVVSWCSDNDNTTLSSYRIEHTPLFPEIPFRNETRISRWEQRNNRVRGYRATTETIFPTPHPVVEIYVYFTDRGQQLKLRENSNVFTPWRRHTALFLLFVHTSKTLAHGVSVWKAVRKAI